MGLYSVIIIKGSHRHRLKPRGFDEAVEIFQQAVVRFGDDHCFFVSCKDRYPVREGFVRRGKLLWCPYCGEGRAFRLDKRIQLYRCPICEVTENEFHVRTANGLWRSPLHHQKRRKRREVQTDEDV